MDAGKRFAEILEQLNREAEAKEDYIVSNREIRMREDGRFTFPPFITPEGSPATDWGQAQMFQKLGLPTTFMRRCPPALRAANFNYFAENGEENRWMLRTFKPQDSNYGPLIRGALSDEYSRFDDDVFLEMIRSMVGTEDTYRIRYFYRDERIMHMQIVFPDLTRSLGRTLDGKEDRHMVGVHITNSEVGASSVVIQPMAYRLVCTNGLMMWTSDGELFRQRHIYLRENEMRGRVAEAMTKGIKAGDEMLDRILAAKEVPVENPLEVIKQLAKDKKYSQSLTDSITASFMREPGDNLFYVAQALTHTAQNLQGDARVQLERDAGELIRKAV